MGQVDKMGKQKVTKDRVLSEKQARWNDVKFVNYELDESQRKACKEHGVSEQGVFDQLLELCSDGYSFGVRFDHFTKAYAAFMQLRGESGINAGLCLTGRGSSPFKAVKQLLYKHYVCLDGDWTAFAENGNGVSYDD